MLCSPRATSLPVFSITDLRQFRPRLAYRALMALGVGAGAVAAGVFVGFLVNGPPQRPLAPRTAAGEVAARRPSVDALVAAQSVEAVRSIPPLPAVEAAARPAPAPGALVLGEVRELQRLLRAAGFNPGPLDGSAGPTTAMQPDSTSAPAASPSPERSITICWLDCARNAHPLRRRPHRGAAMPRRPHARRPGSETTSLTASTACSGAYEAKTTEAKCASRRPQRSWPAGPWRR